MRTHSNARRWRNSAADSRKTNSAREEENSQCFGCVAIVSTIMERERYHENLLKETITTKELST